MDDLVNIVAAIQERIDGSGICLALDNDRLLVESPQSHASFTVVRLYRPSSTDITRAASPDVVLALVFPSQKAVIAARGCNHISVPTGSFHLVGPGLALIREAPPLIALKRKAVKLTGRTGVIAESMLSEAGHEWTLQELAKSARVSQGLAHRVIARLEAEKLVANSGTGPEKRRHLQNPRSLAELWSEEDAGPSSVLRCFLFGNSPEAIATRLLEACPGAAVGGAYAANLYKPVLTRTPYPLRIWVPEAFPADEFRKTGLQVTEEGPNLELVRSKDDPWSIHVDRSGMAKISKWRAWMEIAKATGRTRELAEALIAEIEDQPYERQ